MSVEILIPVEQDSTKNLRRRMQQASEVVNSNREMLREIEAELCRRQEGQSLEEALAELCHEQWSGWMDHLFGLCVKQGDGSVVIPAQLYSRWHRQMQTRYDDLSESEQASDRREARKFADVFSRWERY